MIEGENYTPAEVIKESEASETGKTPTEIPPVEEVPFVEGSADAKPRGDPAATARPQIESGSIGVDDLPHHKPPDGIQEMQADGAQRPGFDEAPSGANTNPPLDPSDTSSKNAATTDAATEDDGSDDANTQQLQEQTADMRGVEEQAMQEDVESFAQRPRPAHTDVKPETSTRVEENNYIDVADYAVDYSLLDDVTPDEKQIFDELNNMRAEHAQALQQDAEALQTMPEDSALRAEMVDDVD